MNEGERRDYRSLGEMIRDAREKRGWSLAQLSERTKIKPRMIEAIEADDLERLSGPVYARGFVRTLSEVLELDTPWLLSKLEGVTGAPPKVNVPAPEMPSSTRVVPSATSKPGPVVDEEEEQTWRIESVRVRRVETPGRPMGRILGYAAAILVLLALAVGGWYFFLRSDDSAAPVQVTRTPPPPAEILVENPPAATVVTAVTESTRIEGESDSTAAGLPEATTELEASPFEGESFAVLDSPVAASVGR